MLAILYDVHGNLPALEAVLADATGAGADRWVLGGDYAAFGPWPAECVDRLRELEDSTWIRGNWERWQAHPDDAPAGNEVVQGAAAWCRARLGHDAVVELGALPTEASVRGTLFVHASPGSDMVPVSPEPEERDHDLLTGVPEHRVVFGHTHVQFRRMSHDGKVELVNPGSVGEPWDGDDRAAYALLGEDGVELRRVAYDVERCATALDAIGEEWSRVTAQRLRLAKFDV
ncbi:MAG: metallophosphoesterase family protein [Solirubrobacterales bacterium]|nr:metallophosphoesterase family protein [Solirubrobacterales bacterium]